MSVSISGVHIAVDDVEAAVKFYRDTLGLKVTREVENDGFHWITLATERQPEIQIVLSEPHAGRSKEDGDALAALLAKGSLGMVQFQSDDLNDTFDKVAANTEAEVLQEPADQFWGVRDAAFRDPAGNTVRIAQR
ncbi:MAG TPA: VOC family protein [Pseudonocardiaceae bacterium]|jgi:catechol 2,3-dioxygenase-like lactoylglutathione lyase family enzyme